MIGYLRAVGIRANLRFMQYAAMRDAMRSRQGAAGAPDLGLVLGQRRVGSTLGVLQVRPADDVKRDPEVRDLLERGDTPVDPAVRKAGLCQGARR